MDDKDVIDRLNSLIETCKDGEKGFRTCAEHAKAENLRSTFASRADECARAATELQACVARLGGKAETGGSATGAMQRGWIDVKSALGGGDLTILESCERGEDSALKAYRDAIKEEWPADIGEIVRRQYEGTKRNHDQIRDLRNSMRAQS